MLVRKRQVADSGVALILVMLAILVLSTLAAAIVYTARAETFASYNFRIGTQAEYVARAGVQRALNFINSPASYQALSTVAPGTGGTEQMGTGSGPSGQVTFNYTVTKPPVAKNSVKITTTVSGSTVTGTDDGSGNITGAGIASGSTVNYRTGYISVTYSTPPDLASPVNVVYLTTTFYSLSVYAVNPTGLYYTTTTPATCSSDCSNSGDVTLGDTAGHSNYPPTYQTNGVDVVSNWLTAMSSNSISDGMGGSGKFTVTAKLLDYHTVNNAFFGVPAPGCMDSLATVGICRAPYEVWQVTSTGDWNNNINAGAANPTVLITATVAPLYLPYFGSALYGLCKTVLSGKVCTDSYNSGAGNYGGSADACATTSTSTGTNASATNAGIGSNGGINLNGTSLTIGGNVTYANATGNATCDIGFQGNDSGVAGSVLPGPPVPTPPPPDMTAWGYAGTGTPVGPPYSNSTYPTVQPTSSGSTNYTVANVYTRTSIPPVPPPSVPPATCPANDGALPPYTYTGWLMKYTVKIASGGAPHAITYGSVSCVGVRGTGGANDPYRLGNIDATVSGTPIINVIAPGNGIGDPTYLASNLVDTGNSGQINTTGSAPSMPLTDAALPPGWPNSPVNTNSAVVLDVGDSIKVGGTASLNFNSATPGVPSPDYLRLNVLGSGGAGSTGSCSGGSVAVDLGGQGKLSAMITAPNGAAKLAGSGGTGVFFGAILASNVLDCGNYAVHYDLSMKVQTGKLYPPRVVSVTRPKL